MVNKALTLPCGSDLRMGTLKGERQRTCCDFLRSHFFSRMPRREAWPPVRSRHPRCTRLRGIVKGRGRFDQLDRVTTMLQGSMGTPLRKVEVFSHAARPSPSTVWCRSISRPPASPGDRASWAHGRVFTPEVQAARPLPLRPAPFPVQLLRASASQRCLKIAQRLAKRTNYAPSASCAERALSDRSDPDCNRDDRRDR